MPCLWPTQVFYLLVWLWWQIFTTEKSYYTIKSEVFGSKKKSIYIHTLAFLIQVRSTAKEELWRYPCLSKCTEISVLEVLWIPRVKESPSELLHPGNIFKQEKYIWVIDPLMGLSAWIPLRSVENTELWDSSGGWAMPALCTPPTREGQKRLYNITAFIKTQPKSSLVSQMKYRSWCPWLQKD